MGGHEALQGAPKGVHGKAKGGEDGGGVVKEASRAREGRQACNSTRLGTVTAPWPNVLETLTCHSDEKCV